MKKCILCGSAKTNTFQSNSFSLNNCEACTFVFRVQEQNFVENDTTEYYTLTRWADEKYARKNLCLLEKYAIPGKILDIGCNIGTFMYEAKNHGWKPAGLDIASHIVKKLKKNGFEATKGTLSNKFSASNKNKFDAVYMSHIIEHIQDPVQFLKFGRSILKPNGKLMVTTPNIESHWARKFQIKPEHILYFNPRTFRLALEKAGFKVLYLKKGNRIKDIGNADTSQTKFNILEAFIIKAIRALKLNKILSHLICSFIWDEIVAVAEKA